MRLLLLLTTHLDAFWPPSKTSTVQTVNLVQAFVETSDDLFVEYDAELQCRSINPAATVVWNLSASEIIGKTNQELIEQGCLLLPLQRFLTEIHDRLRQVLQTSRKSRMLHEVLTRQGRRFYEIAYTPITDDAGAVVRIFSVGRDVTHYHSQCSLDRVQACLMTRPEHELQRYGIALPSILDSMPQCIFWKDINLSYLGCNRRWAEVVQLADPQEIVGKTEDELPWAVGEAQIYQARDRQVMETGKPEEHSLATRLKANGEQLWFDASKIPLRDEKGQVVGVLCIFENVTERKQAAEQLSQSAELLQLVLDNIPQAIFWKDRNSVYLGCNKNWAQAAGIKDLTDVVGKTDFELFWTPEEATLYCEQDRTVMETNTPVLHLIEHRYHADGKQVWIDVNKIPIHDAEGNVIGVLGTIEDITERKQAEAALQQSEMQLRQQAQQLEQTLQELQQTQSQLVQTEKMSGLGQLVAGVAHEINNPVNFIHGNLTHANQYIQDLLNLVELYQQYYPQPCPEIQAETAAIDLDFLMEDLPKLLASMRVGTERIQKIVRSLRNFSRMDEADMKEVNIHEGLDSTLLILQNRLKAKPDHFGIQVVKNYGDLPPIECYAGQLNQVFMNILANAIDALEERDQQRSLEEIRAFPSTITIQTELRPGQRVRVRIQDNGPGMTEAVKQRLFDPFFTTKPVGQGTGLGLSISYQIVTERHKGLLQCHSEVGKGSEFWLEIPIIQP